MMTSSFLAVIEVLPVEKHAALVAGDARTADLLPSGKGQVNIVKILGDKAVPVVICIEDSCWLICHTGFTIGSHAYSGDQELKIHQANSALSGSICRKGSISWGWSAGSRHAWWGCV